MSEIKRKMKRTVEAFKPMPISINTSAFHLHTEKANEKLAVFNSIIEWVSNKVDINAISLTDLSKDAVATFKAQYTIENSGIVNKPLPFEKLAYLTDLDITKLRELSKAFYSIDSQVNIKGDKVNVQIIRKSDFTIYTTTQLENDKLRTLEKLNEVLTEIEGFGCTIYRHQLPQVLGAFCTITARQRELTLHRNTRG